MKFGKKDLPVGERILIMGVLNVTPDSFSDGGQFLSQTKAIEHAFRMVAEGADIIDVGGESTRPGAEAVSVDEELTRVLPVIKEVARKTDVPVSIDSYKPEVAEKAIQSGASMVNDIYGLRAKGMAEVAAKYKIPVCIMHMQGTPRDMQLNPVYADVIKDIKKFLKTQAEYAIKKGVGKDQIIVDPGLGFGKTLEHNIQIIKKLKDFKKLGYPILIGPSRKSFIGKILDVPVNERLTGTIAATTICAMNSADILRVHDVREIRQAVKIVETVIR